VASAAAIFHVQLMCDTFRWRYFCAFFFVVTAVWVINFILPAVIGSLIVFFYKPFGASTK
jgi:hypothetical protein